MVNQQTSCGTLEQPSQLGTLPPKCRSVELQVSPITIVDLMMKNESAAFKTRTLLDSGAGTSWCHSDLLKYVKFNDLGSTFMTVQVFEGKKKKRYRYVEIFYYAEGKVGTLRCFVTDQYAWFNDIRGLSEYAAQQLPGRKLLTPVSPVAMTAVKKRLHYFLVRMPPTSSAERKYRPSMQENFYLNALKQQMVQGLSIRAFYPSI